jgi:hypothetical protein
MFSLSGLFCKSLDNVKKKDELNFNTIETTLKQENSILNSRSPQAAILDESNLVGNWRLNEGSGSSTADSTGNGHTGTINGATWLPGYQGQGLDCESANFNFISIADHDDLSFTYDNGTDKPFSVGCIFKLESGGANQHLVAKSNGVGGLYEWRLYIDNNNYIYFQVIKNDGTALRGRRYNTALDVTGNVYYYAVATYDGSGTVGGIDIYLNATIVDDTDSSSGTYNGMNNTASLLYFGARGNGAGTTQYLDGVIDEVRLYNKTLNQAEVSELYNYTISSVIGEIDGVNDYKFTGQLEGEINAESINFSFNIRSNNSAISFGGVATGVTGSFTVEISFAFKLAEYVLRLTNTHYIDEFYFQPRTINHFDYATDQQNDAWDFIEDIDDWEQHTTVTLTALNGSLQCEDTNGLVVSRIKTKAYTNDINADYYNKLKLYIYTDFDESTFRIGILDAALNTIGDYTDFIAANQWHTLTWDLLSAEWNGYESRIFLDLDLPGAAVFTVNDTYWIDYIFLYHEDLPRIEQSLPKEWWLRSQNDSFTYSWILPNMQSTRVDTDLTVHNVRVGLGVYLSYTAYLDSNYPTSILLPTVFTNTIQIEESMSNENLKDSFNVVITYGLMLLVLTFFTGMIVQLWRYLT